MAAASPAQQTSDKAPTVADSSLKTTGDRTPQSAEDRVVLKVGRVNITEADFNLLLEDVTRGGGTPQSRKSLADSYASALMLSQQAVAEHLDTSPAVKRQLEMVRIQVLSDAAYAEIDRQTKPSPQEISQYYATHLADYDEVQIRRVFIWKQKEGSKNGLSPQEAQARADAIRQALASGQDAKQLTAGSKDILDADPLTFQRGELPPYMSQAFDMKVGEWSEVANTPDSLILFEVVKHDRRDLKQVSPLIEKKLQTEKMRSALDALKQKSDVWMDEKYFADGAASASAKQTTSATPSQQGSGPK